jgi:hypothetical protein
VSEEDVRGGLREAVADEPPLVFDPDALVATARQQVKRRRALLAVGVATVLVAVAAVALPSALGRESMRAANQPPPATSVTTTTTTPFAWPPKGVSLAHYTPDELRTRSEQMALHLRTAVPAALPEASDFAFGEFGGEAAGQFYEGQTGVNTSVSFTVGGARYSIVVTVWVPGTDKPSPTTLCDSSGGGADCTQLGQIGQNGGPIFATTDKFDSGTITTAYHFRQTGTMVQIGAYNYDIASAGPPTYLPTIPVTLQQLTRLASDPDLAL